jgi:hypothetical protein
MNKLDKAVLKMRLFRRGSPPSYEEAIQNYEAKSGSLYFG